MDAQYKSRNWENESNVHLKSSSSNEGSFAAHEVQVTYWKMIQIRTPLQCSLQECWPYYFAFFVHVVRCYILRRILVELLAFN